MQQQQRFSPTSPPHTDPPMTYDEASMQGSRHFFMALQVCFLENPNSGAFDECKGRPYCVCKSRERSVETVDGSL